MIIIKKQKELSLLRYFLILFISIFLSSCASEDKSYFPLADGYKWRYDVTQITRDGLEKQKYILSNSGESQLDEKLVYIRRAIDGTTLYYSKTDSGIEYLGYRSAMGINPEFISERQTVIAFPLSENTTWEQLTTTKLLRKSGPPQKTEFRIVAEVPMEVKVESMNEIVSVPAGKFEQCMKVTMSGSTFKDAGNYVGLTVVNVEQSNWYAKGVGLVKMERVETTKSEALDKGSLLIELAEFSAN